MKYDRAVNLALGIGIVLAIILTCIVAAGEPAKQNLIIKTKYVPAENKTVFIIFYPSGRNRTISVQGLSTALQIAGASVLAPPNGTYVVSVTSYYKQLASVSKAFLAVIIVDVASILWLEYVASSSKKLSFGHVTLLATIAVSLVVAGILFAEMNPTIKVLPAIAVKAVDPVTVPSS